MSQVLRILYRGPLSSCNYGCDYCPFAKTQNTRSELATDAAKLERFVDWVQARKKPTGVLFTPWGEALIRRHYQGALIRLSHLAHVERAAIQTNLSADTTWIDDSNPAKIGIWATYHPEWTDRASFVAKLQTLADKGASVSAGAVGLKPFFGDIEALRADLPPSIYLWINAYKREPNYYTPTDIERLEAIDPHFRTNTMRHPSLGHDCGGGRDAISVDGDGTMRRCHFISEPIGNIYEPDHLSALKPRPCSNDTCGCHIGYVHLDRLKLRKLYGSSVLERVPAAHR